MGFIEPKEFLKQGEEVQRVLIEWWKININQCDLIYNVKFKEIRVLKDIEMFNSELKRNMIYNIKPPRHAPTNPTHNVFLRQCS